MTLGSGAAQHRLAPKSRSHQTAPGRKSGATSPGSCSMARGHLTEATPRRPSTLDFDIKRCNFGSIDLE
jgi:hypothetical protein